MLQSQNLELFEPASLPVSPHISVVIIGRNEGQRLLRCIASVQAADWGDRSYELIYIDSSSQDDSVAKAQALGAKVQVLDDQSPSAAKARNLGWRQASGEFVMFLDGDTELHPDFLLKALQALQDPKLCAAFGHLRELHPEQSIYTRVMDLDWASPVGRSLFFGGIVLVRRSALEAVGGYDPALKAGEEPEMCSRLRALGWEIEHIDAPMALHDLAITTFRAYCLRAYRSGIAYAEVAERMRLRGDILWQHESRRDFWHGLGLLLSPLIFLLALSWSALAAMALVAGGLAIIARSAQRCAWRAPGQTLLHWQYAFHTFFQKIPALLGQLKWRQTRGQTMELVEYKTVTPTPADHATTATSAVSPKLAYLVSAYPAISHTFILREIQRLRALGHQIVTASINRPDRSFEAMQEDERCETAATYFIKSDGVLGALSALLHWLRLSPLGLLVMLRHSLGLGGGARWWMGLAYGVEAMMVGAWMQKVKVSHLHVHFGNVGATIGMLVKQLNGCHLSYTIHGPDEFDDVAGQHLALKMQQADAVICISQFARGQLMRISHPDHWPKLHLCRLGVDPAQFHFSLRDAGPTVKLLCVGRLTPAKCQVLLVQACALLRDAKVDFSLTLVGAGPDQDRIEQAISNFQLQQHITLTGALNQDAVRTHFAQADIFVLPSLAEGIPVVLMEAMSSGVPCVTTPVNGIPELIQHEKTGLLALPGDVFSLTEQLQRLIDQPALRHQLALAAHDKVLADFDLGRNVAKLGQLFAQFPISASN
ncbi:MAG: glycosyltransferase [Burkholderiaceae bacterium]